MSAYCKVKDDSNLIAMLGIKVLSGDWSIEKYVALHYLEWISKPRNWKKALENPSKTSEKFVDSSYDEIIEEILKYDFAISETIIDFGQGETAHDGGYKIEFPIYDDKDNPIDIRMISLSCHDINRLETVMITFSESKKSNSQPWRHNEQFFYHHDYQLLGYSKEERKPDLIANAYFHVMKSLIERKR